MGGNTAKEGSVFLEGLQGGLHVVSLNQSHQQIFTACYVQMSVEDRQK